MERDDEPLLFFAVDLVPDDLAVDDFPLPVFEEDLDRELELPDDALFDVDEVERPPPVFDRVPPLDLDDVVLLPPDELELARPLPLAFLLVDFLVPDELLVELLLRPPVDFVPELELFEVDEDLRPEVDPDPPERPPLGEAAVRLEGTIVSAAAPTAPTAAPVAAPAKISPATSITLSTNLEVVDRVERDGMFLELLVPFLEEDDEDVFAMCFLP